MIDSVLKDRASEYGEVSGIALDFETPLGYGGYGIFYVDPKPGNIMFADWPRD